jgi:uncharacterized protein YqjF (DUF2071 family)
MGGRCFSIKLSMASTFLTAEWRKLIMAQYAIHPSTLAPWLPAGLELDLYKGHCFVSLVGFLFDEVRVKGIAIPFHTRFEEVNLRFYVRRTEADGTQKRGVVFIREFVPRTAISVIANTLYEESYATLPTRYSIESTAQKLSVRYDWRHKKVWQSLAVDAAPHPRAIAENSIEEFITEHYWGYTRRSDGSTSAYEVQHPRWKVYPIQRYAIVADFAALYGPAFGLLNQQCPASVLLAEGSAVSVLSGMRLGEESSV